mmetsp:Transcript_15722/g.36903  ORF Transcript_15722/g.36903 Transcript_15722/m.36903 type:complete len:227 (+) Transcript_15722:75-755(+)|eukprot:CAMPEP_0178443984 /NCGR_PEP_ID=MMETSP0689_2-20121128/39227_1 /TAXON_ID=160604 /ORGANISM="Amphidinium massartii, Strain CS-259" /LENGTH=226 /DNA_ID=CAMNT_0020068109 /DNA_START=75 /DNA_END=755 /DNA_ORIENTATION=-
MAIAMSYGNDLDQMKVVFKEWDTSGKGWIEKGTLLAVFKELQSNIQLNDFGLLLDCFDVKKDGKIGYGDFIDGLFSGEPLQKPTSTEAPSGMSTLTLNIKGWRALHAMSPEECAEVERVVVNALCEMTGDFEGEYFPLATSQSYPLKPGGMTSSDSQALSGKGLLFSATSATGRGVFVANSGTAAVWINERSHLQLLTKGKDAATAMSLFESAIKATLRQDGYDLA